MAQTANPGIPRTSSKSCPDVLMNTKTSMPQNAKADLPRPECELSKTCEKCCNYSNCCLFRVRRTTVFTFRLDLLSLWISLDFLLLVCNERIILQWIKIIETEINILSPFPKHKRLRDYVPWHSFASFHFKYKVTFCSTLANYNRVSTVLGWVTYFKPRLVEASWAVDGIINTILPLKIKG